MKWLLHFIVIAINLYVIGIYIYLIPQDPKPYDFMIITNFMPTFGLGAVVIDTCMIISYWRSNPLYKRVYLFLLIGVFFLSVFTIFNMNAKYDRMSYLILVQNSTIHNLENIEIIARNNQHVRYDKLYPSRRFQFECDCRHPDSKDTLGIELFYELEGSRKRLIVPEPHGGFLMVDTIAIRILSKDSTTVNGRLKETYP